MTIISLIIGIFFILNAIVTNKEAAKFISDPYAYNNEKYGDGYLMYVGNILSWILGVVMVICAIIMVVHIF